MGHERILITGIGGFLGYELARILAKKGYEIGGVERNTHSEAARKLSAELFTADLTSYSAISKAISSFRPDIIIHAAARTRVEESFYKPTQYIRNNVLCTANTAEAARKCAPRLQKFVSMSSVEVYGRQPRPRFPLKEDCDLAPTSPYAIGKVTDERFLLFLRRIYNFPAVILRLTNCFGRSRDFYFVIESIISQMLSSNVIRLGEPKPIRDFIYVDDLVNAIVASLNTDATDLVGKPFNISTGVGHSIEQVVTEVATMLDWHGKVLWHTRPKRPGEIWKLVCDNRLFTDSTGWVPRTTFSDGLAKTVNLVSSTKASI